MPGIVFCGEDALAGTCRDMVQALSEGGSAVEFLRCNTVGALHFMLSRERPTAPMLIILEACSEEDRIKGLTDGNWGIPAVLLYREEMRSVAAAALLAGIAQVLPLRDGLLVPGVLESVICEALSLPLPGTPQRLHRFNARETVLRQAQHIAKLGFWEYDQTLNRLSWSDEVYRIFELEVNEEPATYEGFLKYVHPEDRDKIAEAYRRHMETGVPYEIEHRVITSVGNLRHVSERCESAKDSETGAWYSLGVVHDITERKELQLEQQLHTELLELLVETANAFINLPAEHFNSEIHRSLQKLGSFVKADRFYIFSYDFEKQTASNTHEWCAEGIEPMIEYLQDTDIGDLDLWLEHHCNGRIMKVPDVPALAADDPLRHILEPQGIKTLITMPLMDDGNCTGFIGLDYVRDHHDFTVWEERLLTVFARMLVNARTRFRILHDLSENRNFLDAILENSPSVFYVKDEKGQYTRINRRWTEISDLSPGEVLGKTDQELFPDGTSPRRLSSGSESDGVRHLEERVPLKSGVRHFFTVEFPVKSSGRDATQIVGISTDITELKKLEEVRLEREKALAAVREKNLFLAKMSHEIRTPLHSIIGFSTILSRSLDGQDEALAKIRYIRRSAENLSSMIKNMLDYAKLDSGQSEVNKAPFTLNDVIQELVDAFRLRAEDAGIGFEVERAEGLTLSLIGDANKLRQVLYNLLENALKFTKEGRVVLRLTHEPPGADFVRVGFEVEDTGCGIDERDIPHLYEEYFQGSQGKKISGTGLGLSISNHLVKLMNGKGLELMRTGEQGSVFGFVLPFELVSGPNVEARGKAPPLKQAIVAGGVSFLDRRLLSGLSFEERRTMRLHLEQGEMPDFRKRVGEAETLDDAAKTGLLRLAAQYEYTALLHLLEGESP